MTTSDDQDNLARYLGSIRFSRDLGFCLLDGERLRGFRLFGYGSWLLGSFVSRGCDSMELGRGEMEIPHGKSGSG